MGLDMYLDRHVYIGAEYEHNKVTGEIKLFRDGKPIQIDLSKVSQIVERVGYWRKANAIHAWFVRNVQENEDNCGTYYVSMEDLENLLDAVNTVLRDPIQFAASYLPTQDGFFFGNTEIDEWYIQDLEYTKELIEKIFAENKAVEGTATIYDYYYHSSW